LAIIEVEGAIVKMKYIGHEKLKHVIGVEATAIPEDMAPGEVRGNIRTWAVAIQ
jgi:hypothetical protein